MSEGQDGSQPAPPPPRARPPAPPRRVPCRLSPPCCTRRAARRRTGHRREGSGHGPCPRGRMAAGSKSRRTDSSRGRAQRGTSSQRSRMDSRRPSKATGLRRRTGYQPSRRWPRRGEGASAQCVQFVASQTCDLDPVDESPESIPKQENAPASFKIPVWWRRAVLPSLPWVVRFLSLPWARDWRALTGTN